MYRPLAGSPARIWLFLIRPSLIGVAQSCQRHCIDLALLDVDAGTAKEVGALRDRRWHHGYGPASRYVARLFLDLWDPDGGKAHMSTTGSVPSTAAVPFTSPDCRSTKAVADLAVVSSTGALYYAAPEKGYGFGRSRELSAEWRLAERRTENGSETVIATPLDPRGLDVFT